MRILQIAPQIPIPLDDGGRIGIFGIMKYLSLRGHEVHFVAYRKDSDKGWAERELSKFCKPYILDVNTENKFVPALLNLFSAIPYNISKFIRKELADFLIEFLSETKVDVVHVDHLHLSWTVELIRKYSDAPVFLREHNLEMQIMERFSQEQKNPLLRFYANHQFRKLRKYEVEQCSKFNNCLMISRTDEQNLLRTNSRIKTSIIPAGVESYLLNEKKQKVIPYSLAHIGSLNWLPNLDSANWFINDILPDLSQTFPDIKLYIFGKGDMNKLKISAAVKKNVIAAGYVENIFEALRDKALVVVPLRIGGGIRIKVLEMLAAGNALISSSIGKEGIEVKDGEHLLVADSAEEFKVKIIDFFTGKINVEKLQQNGRSFVAENYTWEKIAEKLEKVYQQYIQKN
jgi:glycosyltransferase involved in cell wall biosynthesis